MKKLDSVLKNYAEKLSAENLKYLACRLEERVGSDIAEALTMMSSCQEIDKLLLSAKSSDELYDMIDTAEEYISREYRKRAPELVET
jgi:hypothetical protein